MRNYIGLTMAILLVPAGLLGCQHATQFAELNTHRLIWEALSVYHYRYTLQVSCFCVPDFTTPVIVEVKNGAPLSLTYAKGGTPPAGLFDDFDTVDDLFGIVEDAIGQQPAALDATYDKDYGFPAQVYIDYQAQVVDEELGFTVSDFEEIEE